MDDVRRVAALFDDLADTYDQVGVDFFRPIGEGLVAALDVRSGERALDLGCGRGAALLPLARAVGPTGWVAGGDLAPRMVGHCRRLAAAEHLDHVRVEVLDAQDPRWPDPPEVAGLDVVVSSLVLFFLPDPAAAVGRWGELLRPGGRVGVATFGSLDAAWVEVDAVFAPHLPPGLLDARTSGARGPFASDAGMEDLLTAAGYVDPTTTHLDLRVEFTDPEQWYRFSWSVGQRAMWLAVSEDQREAVRAEALSRLARSAQPDGSLSFAQDVRYTVATRPA